MIVFFGLLLWFDRKRILRFNISLTLSIVSLGELDWMSVMFLSKPTANSITITLGLLKKFFASVGVEYTHCIRCKCETLHDKDDGVTFAYIDREALDKGEGVTKSSNMSTFGTFCDSCGYVETYKSEPFINWLAKSNFHS